MRALLALLLLICSLSPLPLCAGKATVAAEPGDVARAMDEVLQRREFAWRAPREKAPPQDRGVIYHMVDQILKEVVEGFRSFFRWVGRGIDWFNKRFIPDIDVSDPGSGGGLGLDWLSVAMWLMLAAILSVLGVWLFRLAQRMRQRRREAIEAVAVAEAPDLAKDDVAGDELPVSGWLSMAARYFEQGDYKLALRAYYLASLAELGGLGMLRLKKSKSNREYEAELARRAAGRSGLQEAFRRQGLVFDSSWYGDHPVDEALARQFAGLHEEVMRHASPTS